jgi:hypothetical protein
MRPSRGLGFAFQRTLRRNYDALAKYMDSLHRKQRLRFRIHDRTAASISGLVLRPSTRAPMTIARRILKSRTVFGPPAKLTGFSRDGLTCFHQQLRSSNPGGSYLLDLDCGGDRCPAYVRPHHFRARRPIFRAVGKDRPRNACIFRRKCDGGNVYVPSFPRRRAQALVMRRSKSRATTAYVPTPHRANLPHAPEKPAWQCPVPLV